MSHRVSDRSGRDGPAKLPPVVEKVIERRVRAAGWTEMEMAVARGVARDWNVHRVADALGLTKSTLDTHGGRAARKARMAGLFDLVGSILLEAAAGELEPRAFACIVASGVCPWTLRRNRTKSPENVVVFEQALADVVAMDGLAAEDVCLLRLPAAGFGLAQITNMLGVPPRVVNKRSSRVCGKRGVTRLCHAGQDVLRLACGLPIDPPRQRRSTESFAGANPPKNNPGGGARRGTLSVTGQQVLIMMWSALRARRGSYVRRTGPRARHARAS